MLSDEENDEEDLFCEPPLSKTKNAPKRAVPAATLKGQVKRGKKRFDQNSEDVSQL